MLNSALERLLEDHRKYAGLLCILDRQLYGARRDDLPDIALLRDIFHYMTQHAEYTHHVFEERLYQRLAVRYPVLLPTLEILKEEHRRIHVYGDELYASFAAMPDNPGEAGLEPAKLDLLQAYIELYRALMRSEEQQILGNLAVSLPGSDWMELMTSCDWYCDPLLRSEADRAYLQLKVRIAMDGAGYWMGQDERADSCPLCS